MAALQQMPPIAISENELRRWGQIWLGDASSKARKTKNRNCFDKKQGMDFGKTVIDPAVASALSVMLGNIPIMPPSSSTSLLPPIPNCIEIGDTRVIGGIRPQNFDIAYRPDGLRIAYDSKTLNDTDSVRKNWQNMINDLATEATTVHTRFPYAVVAFMVVIPRQALFPAQEIDIIRTLERLGTRRGIQNQNHLAETISLVIWNAENGTIEENSPNQNSILRIEKFSEIFASIYLDRYKGLPPHNNQED